MAVPLNTCTTIEQRGIVRFGSKGYPQRNAVHLGSISLWISFAASIYLPTKTQNATLFYRGDSFPHLIQKRRSQLGFVTYLLNYLRITTVLMNI
jgi:hypothetical protein